MQSNALSPAELVVRPVRDHAHIGLAALLQQITNLLEGVSRIDGVGELAEDEYYAPPALGVRPAAAIKQTRAPSLAALLVSLNGDDQRLMAEVMIDVEVGEDRYLLLRSTAPAPEEQVLSPREREIVRLVARGYPNKTIAEILEISPWTVNTYLRRIFAKLGVTSRAEMVAHSLVIGLLQHAP